MKTAHEIEAFMKELGKSIDGSINYFMGKRGFALLVFEFGKPGAGNYISNGRREDMIRALRETADRLERRESIPTAIGSA